MLRKAQPGMLRCLKAFDKRIALMNRVNALGTGEVVRGHVISGVRGRHASGLNSATLPCGGLVRALL